MEFIKKLYSKALDFVRQLKRALFFFRLGYRTYAWDYGYTEEILAETLRLQLEYFNGPLTVVDWEQPDAKKHLKALSIVVKILSSKDGFEFKNKPQLDFIFKPTVDGKYYELTYPEGTEKEQDALINLLRAEDRINDKRRKLVFRLIEKYGQGWWD